MKYLGIAALAAVTLAAGSGVHAHHGIINFDLNSDMEIRGIIRRIALVNPHSWVYVEVPSEEGRSALWACELRSATVLRRSGWSEAMFELGSEVTITGSPDRFSENTCYVGTITFADGRSFDRYAQITAPEPEPEPLQRPVRFSNGDPVIAGDWAAEQRVLTDPRGLSGAFLPISIASQLEPGAVPEGAAAFPGARGTAASLAEDPIQAFWSRPSPVQLTEAGRRAAEGFDGSSTDNPRLRCEPTNIMFDWTFDTHVNRITQSTSRIRMLYGFMDLDRTIHLDRTEFPAAIEPSRSGYSIGRWEDDVLIVETRGFLPGVLTADGNTMHSDQLVVTERFFLSDDRQTLNREFSAVDPVYFEGEYNGRDSVHLADLPYEAYNCDERSFRSDVDPVQQAD